MLKFFYETLIHPKNPERSGWYIWIGASTVTLWIIFWWSIGMLPAFGQGFARVENQVEIRVYLVESAILDRRIRYCSAREDTNVKRFFYTSLQEKLNEYRKLTDSTYALPACADLVYDN